MYLGPVVWVANAIIRGFSFSVQVFLRQGVGAYSYGWVTVILSLFLIRFFAIKDFEFQPLDEEFAIFTSNDREVSAFDAICIVGNYTIQALGNLALIPGFVNLKAPQEGSWALWYYSYLFLLLVLFEFFFDLFKSDAENRPSLESRGRSRFLGRLIEPGIKIKFGKGRRKRSRTIKASRPALRFLIEPALILVLAAISYLFGALNMFLFLMFAACSLVWQEYKYHRYFKKITNTGSKDDMY